MGKGVGSGGCATQFRWWQGNRSSDTTNQALNLLENKIICSTWFYQFIDHCILSRANGIQREIKVKGEKLQMFHIMAQNQTFSQGLHLPPRLYQSRSQFGEIATYLWHQRLPCYCHISVCLWIRNHYNRAKERKAGLWDEILTKVIEHFVH